MAKERDDEAQGKDDKDQAKGDLGGANGGPAAAAAINAATGILHQMMQKAELKTTPMQMARTIGELAGEILRGMQPPEDQKKQKKDD